MKKAVVLIVAFCLSYGQTLAQCAMCRSTVVNNVSNGDELGLAAGLNTGILYLFFTPYILIALIGVFWYRSAKKNKELEQSKLARKRI